MAIASIVKWGIVMLIVCASIIILCYVAYNRDEKEGQDCGSCNGDCSSCGKNKGSGVFHATSFS